MATTINDVNTIQIRNAKNGDFDLNLSGGGGGESKPFYPIVTFDDQMQVTDIQQGVVSAQSGTVIGRMGGQEQAFSVITLSNFQPGSGLISRYFVSAMNLGVFELILNASDEITEVQLINGRISLFNGDKLSINSHEIIGLTTPYVGLVSVDDSTEEETITQFSVATGGKMAYSADSNVICLNYGTGDDELFYNKGVNDITFDANAEWYEIVSV